MVKINKKIYKWQQWSPKGETFVFTTVSFLVLNKVLLKSTINAYSVSCCIATHSANRTLCLPLIHEKLKHIELAQRTFRDGQWGMRTITPLTLKMLQVRANRMCTRISFFVSKTGKLELFFCPWPKYSWNESTTSSADGRLTRRRHDVSASLQRPEKSFVQHALVEKKRQTSLMVESFF